MPASQTRFLKIFLTVVATVTVAVALANFILDGDGLYYQRIAGEETAEAFADAKVFAITDLVLDERLLKRQMLETLTRRIRPDCAIIGSSRAMLIGDFYKTSPPGCTTLINLAVSGAGVEDVVLMSYYLARLPAERQPRKIYIDLSHWSFRRGADPSWQILGSDYARAQAFFTDETPLFSSVNLSLYLNLISFDYLLRSFKAFAANGYRLGTPPFTALTKPFTLTNAPQETTILRDGERVYSASQRRAHLHPVITGIESYKASSEAADAEVLQTYRAISRYFAGNGIETIFFLMPYHSANARPPAPLSATLHESDFLFLEFARRHGLHMRGSFLIERTSCKDNEMLDFMHPDVPCVRKIMRSSTDRR